MSNYWFNDDGFSMESAPAPDNDLMGLMFDDNMTEQNPPVQSQNQNLRNQRQGMPVQQSQQHNQQHAPAQDFQQDFPYGGYQKTPQIPEGNSPQMFMNQPENMQQQQQQQAPLDRAKQEQLLKMRQLIMQQQMLHNQQRQQQQQQRPPSGEMAGRSLQNANANISGTNANLRLASFESPQYGSPAAIAKPAPQNMGNMGNQGMGQNYGMGNPQMNAMAASQNLQAAQNVPPAQNVGASQNIQAQSMQASRGIQQTQGGQTPVGSQAGAPAAGNPKLNQAQIAQLQHELFHMTLNDFMVRRGTPITQPPTINNKRVNLLLLHILTRKLGGAQTVLKLLQSLNLPSPQVTEWTNACQKLGVFDGIDYNSNVVAKQLVEKLLGQCYLLYILPYEQYILTEDGQKDILARRVQFQRQLFVRLLQQQQLQLQQQQLQQHQAPLQQRQLSQTDKTAQTPAMAQFQSPNVSQSPHIASMPTPGMGLAQTPGMVQTPGAQPSPAMSSAPHVKHPSNHTSPAVQSPYMQSQQLSRSGSVQRRQSSVNLLQYRPESSQTPQFQELEELPEPTGDPNTIKKYVPIKRVVDTYAGVNLKQVSDIAGEIELTKPVYLFAPELGSLNIHSLIMSLKNYSPANPGEAFSALNTLLVTTTDANFTFKVSDAPELLDTLSYLGLKVLKQITKQQVSQPDYQDVGSATNSTIDDIFNKYVNPSGMKGEDVTYVVDSLTAEVVDDEDSDVDVDDIFSPEAHTAELSAPSDDPEDMSNFELPDFMTGLSNFRQENKYHFSKIQTKSATDEQIFLVDLLITVSMTLRNLSFAEDSRAQMAGNRVFRELLFKTVKAVAVHPDLFVFQRKRLCLLKDCLLILNQIAFHMELDSLEEAFLSFLLVSAFGPKLDDNEDDETRLCAIPKAPLDVYTYLPYGIDAFAKLLVREPKSRAYMQAVLTGSLNITSSSGHPSSSSVVITPHDHHETKNLINAYFKGDENGLKSGKLITRAFKLMMSVIPFAGSGLEVTRFAFQRSSTALQALFGAKLLIDLVPTEDVNGNLGRLTCSWLAHNVQNLLFNLTKNSYAMITESVKFARNTNEHKLLSFVGFRALIVVNSLLGHAVLLKKALEDGELSPLKLAGIEDKLALFKDLYRVQPETEFVLNTLLATSVDGDVSQEVVRLHGLMGKLR